MYSVIVLNHPTSFSIDSHKYLFKAYYFEIFYKFCRLLTQYFDIFQLKGTLREYIETLFKAMPQVCPLLTQYFDIFQVKGMVNVTHLESHNHISADDKLVAWP
jgi:hypothetical protein